MTNKYLLYLVILTSTLIITSCDKDDPDVIEEPELITTLNYTLSPSNGGMSTTLSFADLDGDGGNNALITGGTLMANQTYTGTIELLNESISPTENITEEIMEEDEDHQFFFQTNISDLTSAYNDQDSDGNPIGLSSTINTGAAATGTLTIILRHQPDKSATGVLDGDITNAGGETDIEVTFPIDVQ